MKKQYFRTLIALIGFAAFGAAARGQVLDTIVVKIPYQFVVAGKTLPAGTYRVNRVSPNNPRMLILSNFELRESAAFLATDVENNRTDKTAVAFELVGDDHILSKIETLDHLFTIPISASELRVAAATPQSHQSASGSPDGNK